MGSSNLENTWAFQGGSARRVVPLWVVASASRPCALVVSWFTFCSMIFLRMEAALGFRTPAFQPGFCE